MRAKQLLIYSAGSLALFVCGVAVGQDINPKVHPHLFEAQRLIASADGQIDAAQAAWHDKLGGHAQRAKDLLHQANSELKQAADYANRYK